MKEQNKEKLTMIYPPLKNLLSKVDSRYTLVVASAKRARLLLEGANKMTNCESHKEVTIAINEINEDKITYIRTRSGIK